MTERRVSIVIDPTKAESGARVVRRSFDDIKRGAQEAEGASRGLAKGIAAAAIGLAASVLSINTVNAALRKFVDATSVAEKVQAQLNAALRSTRGVAGQTVASLNAHAAALQKVTAYGDETINGAQALLLTFTKIGGDVFPKATEAVLNVATSMGGDLKSAALQVGKALNDPVRGMTALAESGIQFTESQKNAIKQMVESNNVIGAQAIILGELETQFGGAARAARGTLGGALASLGNAWGDVFELTGEGSARLRQSIEGLIKTISDPRFVANVQAIGTALFSAMEVGAKGVAILAENLDRVAVYAAVFAAFMGAQYVVGLVAAASATGLLSGALAVLRGALIRTGIGAIVVLAGELIFQFMELVDRSGGVAQAFKEIGRVGVDVWRRITLGAQAMGSFLQAVSLSIESAFIRAWANVASAFAEMVSGLGLLGISTEGAEAYATSMHKSAASREAGATLVFAQAQDLLNESLAVTAKRFDDLGVDVTWKQMQEFADTTEDAASTVGGPGGLSDALKDVADPFADLVRDANEFIAGQKAQAAALFMTEEAANALRYEQDMLNQAANQNIKLSADQAREIAALAREMSGAEADTNRLTKIVDRLGDAFASLFDGPITDLDEALSGILGSFAQLGQENLSNVFGGLLSGGAANDNGDPGYASVLEDAVRIGSRDGTKGGFGDVLKNLPGGAGTLSAGLGGLGIGYQTQNPLMGALGGGLQGAAGGPIGMVVGAVAGFIGGIFAEMEAREKARKEIEASRAAIDQFVAAGMGDEISSYVSALAQFTAQGSKLIELAQKAGDSALVSRLQAANDNYKSVLGGKFADDLEATINALSGLEYINSARDALDRYNQRLADAAMLGVDASRAGTELELSLKKLVVEGKLTADQVAGLAGRFPELATALAQVQSTVALFTGATPDELYASVQRAQAQVDSARAEVQRLQQEQTQALVDQASALETVTRATEQAIKSLRQFKDGLRLDAALSPLSPYDRMTEAQSQFQSLASRALDGDQQAIADLPDISRQYLEEARAYYASSETYFSIFGSVESILDQVLGKAEAQLSEDQKQLNALNAQIEHDRAQTALLGSIDSGVMTLGQAMANLAAAIGVLTAAQQAQQNQSPYSPVVNQLYQDVVGRAPDAAGADYWQNIINSGVEMSDVYRQFIHDVIGLGGTPSISSVSQYGIGALGSGGVPKYADGTMFHAGGMAMVGERGPELLNLPRGSQVFPMTTANDNSSGEMLRELRALRGDVADLRRTSAAGSQAMVNAVGGVGSKLDQAGREAELRTRRG